MKKTIIGLTLLSVLGCNSQPAKTQQPAKDKKKTIVIQAIDFSVSTQHLHYVDQNIANQLYFTLAENAGTLKVIGITEHSDLQNIYTLQVPKLDTLSSDVTNIYNKAKIEKANKKKVVAFQQQAQVHIQDYITHVTASDPAKFTDLTNCFSLIQQTLSSPLYQHYDKYVIVCSDMINSPKKGKKELAPLECPNTTFLFVRPALPLGTLQSLLPSSTVMVFTDMADAIEMIRQSQSK